MARQICNGMWVRVRIDDVERTGIAREVNLADGESAVHLVRDDGTTQLIVPKVPIQRMRQAKFNEIPKSRRPDELRGRRLGYR